ncbi:MAG: homocysteine S-methyltransferase family protein [Ignavibacteriaceae bacterium]
MNLSELNPFTKAKNKHRPLILDGAMGSLLQQKGFKSSGPSWMTRINSESPETIISIHKDYIDAGADIITTNTFRTNPIALGNIGTSKIDVESAVLLAKSAVKDKSILIAGSNAPAEDCYKRERSISYKKLKENHINHIDLLIDNSVDFVLNETQSHYDEIEIICIILEHKVLAIGINCISPAPFSQIVKMLNENINFGFYLNCIKGSQKYSKIECGISPIEYGEIVKEYLQFSPSFIGACCGSSPEHIREIKKVLDG